MEEKTEQQPADVAPVPIDFESVVERLDEIEMTTISGRIQRP